MSTAGPPPLLVDQMAQRTALITGVSGQDGVYLARLLLAKGYRVVGTLRPGGRNEHQQRVQAYLKGVDIVECDLRDLPAMASLVAATTPDEVYNLAALSSVGRSWSEPDRAAETNGAAAAALVQAVVDHRNDTDREVRFFQASSAELEGEAADSPYAQGKRIAQRAVVQARESAGLHAVYAGLYIHDSPLRQRQFLTRKITAGAAKIAAGLQEELTLGDLDVVRDWGFAGDYVEAMWLMLAADRPLDLALGTGVAHTVADVVEVAFAAAGVGDPWSRVSSDPGLIRPKDTPRIVADPLPATEALGWRASLSFEELIAHMVAVDVARLRDGVEDDASYLHP